MSRCGDNEELRNNILAGLCWRKLEFVKLMLKAGTGNYGAKYIAKLRKKIAPLRILLYPHTNVKHKIKILLFKLNLKLYSVLFLRFRQDKA